jgi:hypothetical protein
VESSIVPTARPGETTDGDPFNNFESGKNKKRTGKEMGQFIKSVQSSQGK